MESDVIVCGDLRDHSALRIPWDDWIDARDHIPNLELWHGGATFYPTVGSAGNCPLGRNTQEWSVSVWHGRGLEDSFAGFSNLLKQASREGDHQDMAFSAWAVRVNYADCCAR